MFLYGIVKAAYITGWKGSSGDILKVDSFINHR